MVLAILASLILAAAAHAGPTPQVSTAPANNLPAPAPLRLLSGTEIPLFADSLTTNKAHAYLVRAGLKTAAYLSKQPSKLFRIADRDYGPAILEATAREFVALWQQNLPLEEFNAKVREGFDVFQSIGLDGQGRVVFSSYYQPELAASMAKGPNHPYPIYKKPPDMVEVSLPSFDKKYPGETLIGRVTKDKKVVPYFNRDQIDSHKALGGKGLEASWLKTKFDILDLHIQGSGILRFPSGKAVLAQFAATNAWPYNSVGLSLVKAGVFTREEITHDKLRQYFRDHPEAEEWSMAQNPRYTFFKLMPLPADDPGTARSRSARSTIPIDTSMSRGALAYFNFMPQADEQGKMLGKFPWQFCLLPRYRRSHRPRPRGHLRGPANGIRDGQNQWADGQLTS